jgi:uncharacterized protein involved in type VI secretion and phage assembly
MRPLYDIQSVFADQIQTSELEATKVYEPVIGVVTDNKDPSKLGRVKLKMPILSDKDTTFWVPIIMQGAGKNRGWFFIPEVDDEVLVMFEQGDINRPLVVGALWGGKDKPPDKNDGGDNPRRVIKSRQGSKVTFDDKEMKIIIEDGTGKGKITFDSNNNKIIFESLKGDVCVQSPKGDTQIVAKNIEMKAANSVEIHAGSKMDVGAGSNMDVKSPSNTLSGSKVNLNCGNAQAPQAPTSDPKDVDDPYGS